MRRSFLATLVCSLLLLAGCGSASDKAQSYYDRGMALIKENNDLAARVELLNSVKYKSDKVETWRALAGVDERTKAYQPYFQDLRRIVELDPDDVDARIKLVRMLLAGGAPEAALSMIDVAGAGADRNAALHSLKAAIFMQMKDTVGALQEAQKASELDPGDVEAAILLASDRMTKGDPAGAVGILSQPKIESKNDLRAEQVRARALTQNGQSAEAEAILRRLLAQEPNVAALHGELAQIYVVQRRFDDAEKELRAIVTAHPENPQAEMDVVRFLGTTKGLPAARNELVNRTNAGGDVFRYQMALAELDLSEGKPADAISRLEKLVGPSDSKDRSILVRSKLAEAYFRKSDFVTAEKLTAELIKQDPLNIAGLKIRAAIRIEQGSLEAAIADLREALNGQPKAPDLLQLLGLAYERDGKRELAGRQYAEAVRSSGGNPALILQYARFLSSQGRSSEAEDLISDSIKANPKNLELLRTLAQIRLSLQDWKGALSVADSIQEAGTTNEGISELVRGLALAGQGNMDQAITALQKAHEEVPGAIEPVAGLVNAFRRTGQLDKAERLLMDTQKASPQSAEISVLLGTIQLQRSKSAEAEKSFQRAIEQQPKYGAAYVALSNLYLGEKNESGAAKVLKDGMVLDPDNLNLRLANAEMLFKKGEQHQAIAAYEEILKRNPDIPVAINNLASLLSDYGTDKESWDRAATLADRLEGSNVPRFQDTRGWAQYRKGDYQAAASTLEAAKAQAPDLAAVRYHLAMAYMALGNQVSGQEELKEALRLEPEGSELKKKIRSALN